VACDDVLEEGDEDADTVTDSMHELSCSSEALESQASMGAGRATSWQPKTMVKNWITDSSSTTTKVELIHTCVNGARVTVTIVPPDIPARCNHMFNADGKGTIRTLFEGSDKELSSRPFNYEELSGWLLTSEKISKLKLGDYLGRNDPHAIGCMTSVLQQLQFKDLAFDEALRFFLSLFRLPGEAQQIDRIMEAFAKRYTECHPNVFTSADTAYVLAFSVIMLNTDAHSPQIVNKMTQEEFLRNNRGIGENGTDLPNEILSQLYQSIVTNEIKLEQREFISSVQEGWLFKQGGRIKNWKKRYTILSGNVLYYFKTPKDISPAGFIPLENVEVVRHDKTLCFELKPADGGKGMKSVHMAKEKGKPAARFESGHHKSFMFKTTGFDALEDWVAAVQQHAVTAQIPQVHSSKRPSNTPNTPSLKASLSEAPSSAALTQQSSTLSSLPSSSGRTTGSLAGKRNNVNTYRT